MADNYSPRGLSPFGGAAPILTGHLPTITLVYSGGSCCVHSQRPLQATVTPPFTLPLCSARRSTFTNSRRCTWPWPSNLVPLRLHLVTHTDFVGVLAAWLASNHPRLASTLETHQATGAAGPRRIPHIHTTSWVMLGVQISQR